MTFAKVLAYVLMSFWQIEAGVGPENDDPRYDDKMTEVSQLTDMFVETAKDGHLVDPETDAAILGTISWFESRIMLKPKDGDPRFSGGRNGKYQGSVVGPMQISKGAPIWVKTWPMRDEWLGLTVEQMRDPKTNVKLAYDILTYWKDTCGGPPGVWISAYGSGKCPGKYGKNSYSITKGARGRCKMLVRIMQGLASNKHGIKYVIPPGFSCAEPTPEKK
jgi:hypothetical protein